ncbi:ABC transporter ATP-binding protein [Candidatus Collierbacteria bacterium RIFOXYB2_FULL_46_14]|uniref:ABC-type antimicrobial peptide transport system, ATPase component n=1 Tax=Candidatus Collierbacteria bacterium GW2011_GWA2_46_26 TaxID=1618381 RepID=A0A0G1PMA3_9BACT|nr:MAG: ABC-type antimicrobial peptide transport system, ATPase component [Candidatus Collierbacteria bacterium GW2011_GWC2_44_13]KKU33929.1 MAG: ABC-type antimicrobial peptide transport system, ATPase component [Candidatus Collierbacteria bacterium GW2011_GWA2_46_26]OGD73003.1 MAG: ABC transporter ATP-binding protein [Candidatus Collierbacteria bacterium RIFOXYB2_FULL_46_14]OGD76045.1 MAG: ABC transporter ATP-binding protein [Candidatus Collierbacteria bacterium RIFOXYA2_FULL_46_20]OGD77381.1 
MKTTSSIISLKNLWKEYVLGDETVFTALRDINLDIHEGEFSAIIGPSGSGKSTLMHMIGLLDKPTRGEIIVNGNDVAKLDDNQTSTLRNSYVGFVFQQFNLLNKLTIKENILLPATYSRRKLDFDPDERAEMLMEKFGILSKKDSFPNKISGGQQQRVAVARALIMKPQLVLADEPTGNLDRKTGTEIINLFEDLNKSEGITVVMVTHEMEIAERTGRQIKILDGQVVSDKK